MDDHFRVSDADRDRAVAMLRVHFAAGRLTAGDLDERLAVALNSKTFGDLRPVLAGPPGSSEPLQRATSRSPHADSLARGYRRLLACYPAWYRRVHEDEMLAVLLTDAPPEKRRPGIAEAADLLLGALRIRCQPSRTGGAEPAWRDALAVVSVIVPLIVLLTSAVSLIQLLMTSPPAGETESITGLPQALTMMLALAALVLLARRMRRLAAFGVTGLLIAGTLNALQPVAPGMHSETAALVMSGAFYFLALGMEVVALSASPGPRRALQLLTWKHWLFAVITTLLAATSVIPMNLPVRFAVIAAVCAAMTVASSLGRWLLLWLAVLAYPSVARSSMDVAYLKPSGVWIAMLYLPSLALAALAIVAARPHRAARPN